MREPLVVHDAPERLVPQLPLADLRVPVSPGRERLLGVVHVEDADVLDPDDPVWREIMQPYNEQLAEAWFSDGGDMDNKPFSYAISALESRSGGPTVDRKLVYIEPNPDTLKGIEPSSCTPRRPMSIASIRLGEADLIA